MKFPDSLIRRSWPGMYLQEGMPYLVPFDIEAGQKPVEEVKVQEIIPKKVEKSETVATVEAID